jgi:hypothetical protein
VNHSQFADDVLLMSGVSIIIVSIFRLVLDAFLDASRGVVDHRKSQVFGWNTKVQVMNTIARIFQFPLAEN